MRLVIQRVTRASVTVDQEVVGKIKKGFLVFVGIGASDDKAIADKYLKKCLVFGFLNTKMERQIFL